MTTNQYISNYQLLTDEAVMKELGEKIKQTRLKLNMTQTEMAKECGIAKRTLERFEHGASVQLTNFIRILRIIGQIEPLLTMIPEPTESPMAMLLKEDQTRYRASGKKKRKKETKAWEWGE